MRWTDRRLQAAAVLVLAALAGGALTLGGRQGPPDDARAALPGLLTQVYQAFALTDEAAIYAALDKAATGELIAKLYLERRAAQVADHAEGSAATVIGVEMVDVAQPDPRMPVYDLTWRVVGRISHAEHAHERINFYRARVALADEAGGWRIAAFDLDTKTRTDPMDFEGGE